MMAITNDKDFKDWLKKQPQETHIMIATRAALRVFPLVAQHVSEGEDAKTLAFLTGRAILTAAVARTWPTAAVKKAAAFAATDSAFASTAATATATDSAFAAAFAAASTSASASTAAAAATSASDDASTAAATSDDASTAAFAASYKDMEITIDDPFMVDLWHDGTVPDGIKKAWTAFDNIAKKDSTWAFWREWYQGFLDGKPMDWDLQKKIALIKETDWNKGPEHIAGVIEGFRTSHKSKAKPPAKPVPTRKDIEALQTQLAEHKTQLAEHKTQLAEYKNQFATARKTQTAKLGELEKQVTVATEGLEGFEADTKTRIETASADYEKSIKAAAAAFTGKNALEEPVKLWETKRKEHQKSRKIAFFFFCIGLLAVAAFITTILYFMFVYFADFSKLFQPIGCDSKVPDSCKGFSYRGLLFSAAMLTLSTLLLWFTRLQMKLYLAERHLALDACERRAFAQVYVGFLKLEETSEEAKDQRALVYSALFRPTTDGIVKEEGGLDPSIAAAISKLLMPK